MKIVVRNAFVTYKELEQDYVPQVGEKITFIINRVSWSITVQAVSYNEDETIAYLNVNY